MKFGWENGQGGQKSTADWDVSSLTWDGHLCPLWHHRALSPQFLPRFSEGFVKSGASKARKGWTFVISRKFHAAKRHRLLWVMWTNRRTQINLKLRKTKELNNLSQLLYLSQINKVYKKKLQQHSMSTSPGGNSLSSHCLLPALPPRPSPLTLTCPLWNPSFSADMEAKAHFSQCQLDDRPLSQALRLISWATLPSSLNTRSFHQNESVSCQGGGANRN